MAFGLERVEVRGFRSLVNVTFRPGTLSALVGEARAGKSNLLAAIRDLLDPGASPFLPSDATAGGDGRIRVAGTLGDGTALLVKGGPGAEVRVDLPRLPPVLFLPADLRSGPVVAPARSHDPPHPAADVVAAAVAELAGPPERPRRERGATASARALVAGIELCCEGQVEGVVILMEEPELFLPPQTQRYLYRLLRTSRRPGTK